jgi:hypothetical protein
MSSRKRCTERPIKLASVCPPAVRIPVTAVAARRGDGPNPNRFPPAPAQRRTKGCPTRTHTQTSHRLGATKPEPLSDKGSLTCAIRNMAQVWTPEDFSIIKVFIYNNKHGHSFIKHDSESVALYCTNPATGIPLIELKSLCNLA